MSVSKEKFEKQRSKLNQSKKALKKIKTLNNDFISRNRINEFIDAVFTRIGGDNN